MAQRPTKKAIGGTEREQLMETLKARFERHRDRHGNPSWAKVLERLEARPDRVWSLHEMERTGGEPEVIGRDKKTSEFVFFDCSRESPSGRRSLCYDGEALNARKAHKPKGSAVEMANAMGAELLTETEYRELQRLDDFDTKTSSWLKTPPEIRRLGGAIFGDFRFGTVFIYHNGAESYYGARGFRCSLRV